MFKLIEAHPYWSALAVILFIFCIVLVGAVLFTGYKFLFRDELDEEREAAYDANFFAGNGE